MDDVRRGELAASLPGRRLAGRGRVVARREVVVMRRVALYLGDGDAAVVGARLGGLLARDGVQVGRVVLQHATARRINGTHTDTTTAAVYTNSKAVSFQVVATDAPT